MIRSSPQIRGDQAALVKEIKSSVADLREVKAMGDGFRATFDGLAPAVLCVCPICPSLVALGIDVRAGLHTGEIEPEGDGIAGVAVAIGVRVDALAGQGEVFVSSTGNDLVVGSGLASDDRGEHVLMSAPDAWRLFAAAGD